MPPFCGFTICLNPPRCHLLLLHNMSESTAMLTFCCFTICLNSSRCHLLLLHDISESNTMSSFLLHTILSYLHKLLSLELG
jgi:hypothetical protein